MCNHTGYSSTMDTPMFNPPHPGEIVQELCLRPLGLSVAAAAKALGVSRKTLSCLINGRCGISAEMAQRLAIAFNTTPQSWLMQQAMYDLYHVRRSRLKVQRLVA